jgi:predicted PurR-regulated permease PerM
MTESSENLRVVRSGIVFAFGLALACYLAWVIRDVLVLLYVSALFAVVLSPLVRSVSRIRIGRRQPFRKTAVLVLLLAVVGGLALFGFLALPPVIRDLQQFAQEAPSHLPALLDRLKHIPFADRLDTGDLSSRIEGFLSQAVTQLLLSIRGWANALFDILMGILLTIYFILEGDVAYRWFLSFIPVGRRERLDATLRRAETGMGKWLVGQGSLMVILGVTSTIVYAFLGVRYAYALGVLTGLLNIFPVVGAAVCVALAILVAAIDSWGRVLGVAIFYVIYINLENSILIPRIMRTRVGLPALATLVALLVGSELAGVVGAMVSVPTAVLVGVLLDEYLVCKPAA